MVVVSHLFFFFQINFREGMTRCESYPPCFGTIYFPIAPFSVLSFSIKQLFSIKNHITLLHQTRINKNLPSDGLFCVIVNTIQVIGNSKLVNFSMSREVILCLILW